jgi:hypothetical protein
VLFRVKIRGLEKNQCQRADVGQCLRVEDTNYPSFVQSERGDLSTSSSRGQQCGDDQERGCPQHDGTSPFERICNHRGQRPGYLKSSLFLERLHILDNVDQFFGGHRFLQVGGHEGDRLLFQAVDLRLLECARNRVTAAEDKLRGGF